MYCFIVLLFYCFIVWGKIAAGTVTVYEHHAQGYPKDPNGAQMADHGGLGICQLNGGVDAKDLKILPQCLGALRWSPGAHSYIHICLLRYRAQPGIYENLTPPIKQ